MNLWESIKDLRDFEVDRNRRSDITGKREKISVRTSGGRSGRSAAAIVRKEKEGSARV
jgi:hypothetical protein